MDEFPFDASEEEIDEFADAWDQLLTWAAQTICGGASFAQFQQALRAVLPARLPGLIPAEAAALGAEHPDTQRMIAGLAVNMSYEIWNATPQPANRFRPLKEARPERNARCPCGSGRKFKQCCGELGAEGLAIPPGLMLAKVLATLSRNQLAELPLEHLAPSDIALVVETWREENRDADALVLLEALFADLGRLDGRAEHAADQLLQLYDDLGKPRKKIAFLERLKASPDRNLRSAALQRETSMLADRDDFDAAWKTFREAQRLTPNAPSLAHLEVLVLLNQGRRDEAIARSAFWCAQLARDPDNDYSDLIDLLRALVDESPDALVEVQRRQVPGFDRLAALFEAPPAPTCHYRWRKDRLSPTAALAEVESDWADIFDDATDDAAIGRRTVRLFAENPLAWQSFPLLYDLLAVVRNWPDALPGSLQPYLRRILAHAEALRVCVLEALDAGERELAWDCAAHRPLLSLAAAHAFALGDEAPAQAVELFAWLVRTADPADHQGLRSELVHRYLQLGDPDAAQKILARFANDLPEIEFGRALAFHLGGREAEATAALRQAHARFPKFWTYLQPETVKAPKVAAGDATEAWHYREDQRALWQKTGALDWAVTHLGAAGKSPAKRLEKPAAAGEARLQIKIVLDHVEPAVWRRVLVAESLSFAQLHAVVQAAMGWDDSHLHEFTLGRKRIVMASGEDYLFGGPGAVETEVTLAGELGRRKTFAYQYDFGDSWEHTLSVEKRLPAAADAPAAELVAGEGACPPEDCGGPWGYDERRAAFADPDHPEHVEALEWFGDEDPTRFALEPLQSAVAQLAKSFRRQASR